MVLGIQVGGGLIVLFTIFLLVMSFKTWKFFHIFMAFLLFGTSIACCIYAAAALKTRTAWAKVAQEQEARIEGKPGEKGLRLQLQEIESGDPDEIDLSELSVYGAREMLWQETNGSGLGRVWRNCPVKTPFNGTTITLYTEPPAGPPPAGAAAPAPPAPNQIQVNEVLHLFKEGAFASLDGLEQAQFKKEAMELLKPSEEEWNTWVAGWKLPKEYLGSLHVTAVTDTDVTLAIKPPTVPNETTLAPTDANYFDKRFWDGLDKYYVSVNDEQKGLLQSLGASTVTVYERMPADRHDAFAGMDKATLQVMFPASDVAMDGPDKAAAYERFIDTYRFDGKTQQEIDALISSEGDRLNAKFTPTPDESWVRIEFIKDYEIVVDDEFDLKNPPDVHAGRQFDDRGLAIVPDLLNGGPAAFKVGSQVVVDRETAQKLEAEGVITAGDPVFVRELNDFEYLLAQINKEIKRVEEDTAAIRIQGTQVADAHESVRQQRAVKDAEYNDLQEDYNNFDAERTSITDHHGKLKTQWASMRKQLSDLYKENKGLERELQAINDALTAAIEKRVAEELIEAP